MKITLKFLLFILISSTFVGCAEARKGTESICNGI